MKTEVKFREPEEKPLFKVGDRPKWTPELIKQLPHGTVLNCAFYDNEVFTYNGDEVFVKANGSIRTGGETLFVGQQIYFFISGGEYSQIISLPDIREASPESQQEFVKANPGMQHVEEPKAGDMVEVSDTGNKWFNNYIFTGGKTAKGRFICELNGKNNLSCWDMIRLPQKSDPDRELKEIAKPIMEYWGFIEDGKCDPCILAALVDMGKKVKSKNKYYGKFEFAAFFTGG